MAELNQLDRLLTAVQQLTEFLNAENSSLKQQGFSIDEGHIKQKDQLVHAYEANVLKLEDYADELAVADPQQLQSIRDAGDALKDLIADNTLRLRARHEASMQLITAYTQAVVKTGVDLDTYSSAGHQNGANSRANKRVNATAIDQSL